MTSPYFPYNWDNCSCIDVLPFDGAGCAEWDEDGVWCYVDSSCSLEKVKSNHHSGLYWSTEVCEGLKPTFPPTGQCRCLEAEEMGIPEQGS